MIWYKCFLAATYWYFTLKYKAGEGGGEGVGSPCCHYAAIYLSGSKSSGFSQISGSLWITQDDAVTIVPFFTWIPRTVKSWFAERSNLHKNQQTSYIIPIAVFNNIISVVHKVRNSGMHPLFPGAIPFFLTSGYLRSPDLLFYQRIPYLNFSVKLTADYFNVQL